MLNYFYKQDKAIRMQRDGECRAGANQFNREGQKERPTTAAHQSA